MYFMFSPTGLINFYWILKNGFFSHMIKKQCFRTYTAKVIHTVLVEKLKICN